MRSQFPKLHIAIEIITIACSEIRTWVLSDRIGNESAPIIWHSASSLGWPFPVLKYKHLFQMKYTEAILSNSIRKLLWFEITEMLIAV